MPPVTQLIQKSIPMQIPVPLMIQPQMMLPPTNHLRPRKKVKLRKRKKEKFLSNWMRVLKLLQSTDQEWVAQEVLCQDSVVEVENHHMECHIDDLHLLQKL